MHVKTGAVAYAGMMMALAVVCIVLGGVLEMNTLFLLAIASFMTGFMEKSFSVKMAAAFMVGTTLLGLILAPKKLYALTFCGFALYILLEEYWEERLQKSYGQIKEQLFLKQKCVSWLQKGIVYHVLLGAAVFLTGELYGFQDLLQTKLFSALEGKYVLLGGILLVMAEAFWLIFDYAYYYVRQHYGKWLFYHVQE